MEELFLKQVKAILIVIGVLKRETVLDRESWLQYYRDGFTPIRAVKEDFDGCTLPFISWEDVQAVII